MTSPESETNLPSPCTLSFWNSPSQYSSLESTSLPWPSLESQTRVPSQYFHFSSRVSKSVQSKLPEIGENSSLQTLPWPWNWSMNQSPSQATLCVGQQSRPKPCMLFCFHLPSQQLPSWQKNLPSPWRIPCSLQPSQRLPFSYSSTTYSRSSSSACECSLSSGITVTGSTWVFSAGFWAVAFISELVVTEMLQDSQAYCMGTGEETIWLIAGSLVLEVNSRNVLLGAVMGLLAGGWALVLSVSLPVSLVKKSGEVNKLSLPAEEEGSEVVAPKAEQVFNPTLDGNTPADCPKEPQLGTVLMLIWLGLLVLAELLSTKAEFRLELYTLTFTGGGSTFGLQGLVSALNWLTEVPLNLTTGGPILDPLGFVATGAGPFIFITLDAAWMLLNRGAYFNSTVPRLGFLAMLAGISGCVWVVEQVGTTGGF